MPTLAKCKETNCKLSSDFHSINILEKDSRFIDEKTNLLLEWAKFYTLSHETARIPKEEMKEWKKSLNKPKKLKAA
jgi:hypothetical protein